MLDIRRIDDRILSNGAPGPISRQIHAEYWKKHQEGWKASPVDYGA